MSKLKALLFDVDGTLADTERDGHRVAFNKAFQEAGIDWDWTVEHYGALLTVTGGKERIRYHVENYCQDDAISEGDLMQFSADLHKRKTYFYLEMLQNGEIPLRVGAERLIKEARAAGYRLAIVTTTTPANVSYLLTATLGKESIDWFEVIAAGDIVPAKKPAPDIYQYAMEKMNLTSADCLAFEDSDNGVRSSVGADLKTLVTINGYTHAQDFSGATLVVDQFGESDQPFTVLEGNAGDASYVNLALLEQLHQGI